MNSPPTSPRFSADSRSSGWPARSTTRMAHSQTQRSPPLIPASGRHRWGPRLTRPQGATPLGEFGRIEVGAGTGVVPVAVAASGQPPWRRRTQVAVLLVEGVLHQFHPVADYQLGRTRTRRGRGMGAGRGILRVFQALLDGRREAVQPGSP